MDSDAKRNRARKESGLLHPARYLVSPARVQEAKFVKRGHAAWIGTGTNFYKCPARLELSSWRPEGVGEISAGVVQGMKVVKNKENRDRRTD